MAKAFGAPIMLKAPERDGSLREAARKLGIPVWSTRAARA